MENLKTSPGSKSQTSDDHCNTTKSLPHSHTGKANDKVSRAWGSLQEIRKVAGCEHDNCMVSVRRILHLSLPIALNAALQFFFHACLRFRFLCVLCGRTIKEYCRCMCAVDN